MRLGSLSVLAIVSLLGGLVGCGAGRSAVEISLEGEARGVTSIVVTVDNHSKTSLPVTYTLAGATDIPPAKTLALQFDASRSGAITVHVEGRSASGVVATGTGTGTLTPGKQSSPIPVTLTPTVESMPDLLNPTNDLGPSDLANQPDLTGGGPTLRGGFVSSAGTVTEGTVTLTGHFYWQGSTMTATNGGVTLTGWFQ